MQNAGACSEVAELFERGLYLQAYEASREIGPLRTWSGASARLLASRLANQLGAPRLGGVLGYLAWREAPAAPEAILAYASILRMKRGPCAAWKFLQVSAEPTGDDPAIRADWLASRGQLAAVFRDFDSAEEWHRKAVEAVEDRPSIWIQRSNVLAAEDRYPDALAAVERALELQPWYVPAVRQACQVLVLLGRDEDALALYEDATRHVECGHIWLDYANLQSQLGEYEAAREDYQRAAESFPLMEKGLAHWLAGRRSDMACLCGYWVVAKEFAWLASNPFHHRIARALTESGPEGKRVLLSVRFVRQHHMTCAPATLTAISEYWSVPANHLEIADEICYNGTPSHAQRNWAEQRGWAVREFTVTWESTRMLIDRGVPIAVSTVEPTNAHMQAIVGYDTRRDVLLVRDPYSRELGEFLIDQFHQRYQFCGPRGLVMVPAEKAELLDGVNLEDNELYDLFHRLQLQLVSNDREAAETTLQAMEAEAPGHRLSIEARRCLGDYDGDSTTAMGCVDQLLDRFPGNAVFHLQKLAYLGRLGRRSERIALLERICNRPGCHPIFLLHYAAELSNDAREHTRAFSLARRVIRYAPQSPQPYQLTAAILSRQRRFEEAIWLNRMGSCLDDKDEDCAHAYFKAARHLKKTEDALEFLRRRVQRLAKRSSQPICTLFRALEEIERGGEAFSMLADALVHRNTDYELMLFAADTYARHGRFEEAEKLLERARHHSHIGQWLRCAAQVAMYRGERAKALGFWQEALEKEPQATDAQHAVAQLLAEVEGTDSALKHLGEAAEKWPHNYELQRLRVYHLQEIHPEFARQATRRLVEVCPTDAWARRQLAWFLTRLREVEEGFREAQIAQQLEPSHPHVYFVLGRLHLQVGRVPEAREAFRRAIRLSVDAEYAIEALMSLCQSNNSRREELAFLAEELKRQVIFGDGLLTYRRFAREVLEPAQLLQTLQEANQARPDLRQSWSALMWQLAEMGRLDEAKQVGTEATKRFPLVPEVWHDIGYVHHICQDSEATKAALQEAINVAPQFSIASRQLAHFYQAQKDFTTARALLERAVAHDPLEPQNHLQLAVILWRIGEREDAVNFAKRAVLIAPNYQPAWAAVLQWCHVLKQPEVPVVLAEELVARRPGDPFGWLALARMCFRPEDLSRRLEALDRAIALYPTLIEAHDLRVQLLIESGRLDDACAACQGTVFGEQLPPALRARMAEIEFLRGNLQRAIGEMRATVALDPTQPSHWNHLLSWLKKAKQGSAYLETVQQFVGTQPHESASWQHLGEAKLESGDRLGGREALLNALRLSPSSTDIACRVFDILLEEGDLATGTGILDHIRPELETAWKLAFEIALFGAQNDAQQATARLFELCKIPSLDAKPLEQALKGLELSGWKRHAQETLSRAMDDPNVPRCVAEVWARICHLDQLEFEARFRQLESNERLWQGASAGYVRALGAERKADLLQSYLNRHGDRLTQSTETWKAVGESLLELGDPRKAAEWLSGWHAHPGLDASFLERLSFVMFETGRRDEAIEIHLQAEKLTQDSHSRTHLLWLAAEDVIEGRLEEADSRLQRVLPGLLSDYHLVLHALVAAMIRVERPPVRGSKKPTFRSSCTRFDWLIQHHRSQILEDRRMASLYRRYLDRLALTRGGVVRRVVTRIRLSSAKDSRLG